MLQITILRGISLLLLMGLVSKGDTSRKHGFCPWMTPVRPLVSSFRCYNGEIISRDLVCDGMYDCADQSDELCDAYLGRCSSSQTRCGRIGRCISSSLFCDGVQDCTNGFDEQDCTNGFDEQDCTNGFDEQDCPEKLDNSALVKSLQWLYRESKPASATQKWGSLVDKTAVALYFADPVFSTDSNGTRKEIAYEVSIKLLSKIFRKKLQDVPSTDLASFVNAFIVSCLDPRKFHGLDIVQELRNRADKQNYTNPYVYLALCNAGETITESDKMKLIDTFWNKRRTFWTDMQAVTVLALACASQQPGNGVDEETLHELTMELKQHQYRNGSVESLQTTALVMQALLAAEPDADPDNFDEKKAVEHIYQSQKPDGSFGNLINTYFVLPVLSCRSLINISSDHCQSVNGNEISALEELINQSGPKIRVQYSLWIGNDRDLERNLALRVPANMSFYGIMEKAAELDSKFRFECIVKDRVPYINAIYDIQDNPEKGQFWFLYSMKDEKPTLIEKSPAKVIPKNNEHFIMWYRRGSWVK